jgi:hypothetical protein
MKGQDVTTPDVISDNERLPRPDNNWFLCALFVTEYNSGAGYEPTI